MDVSFRMRLLTALIGIPFIILLLFSPVPVMTGIVMLVSVVGLYEFFKAAGLLQHKLLCLFGFLAALIIPVGSYLAPGTSLAIVYLYVVLLFCLMLASKKKITFTHLAIVLIGLLYIPYFLSHILYIRTMQFGNFYVWLVFLGAFMTDSCAFFAGKALGRHKLCPNISPKKTVEGAIGGVVGCGLSFILFGIIINAFFTPWLAGQQMNLWMLFVLGIFAAMVSEIGDLVASMIKRQFGIKDFGNILPGHGGILDRCDSIVLVAPLIFLFILKFGILF